MTKRLMFQNLDYPAIPANGSVKELLAATSLECWVAVPLTLALCVRATHVRPSIEGLSLAVAAFVAASSIVLASLQRVRSDYPELDATLSIIALAIGLLT